MKLKTILSILLLTAFFYLIGAFVAGDWNSANWDPLAKAMLAFMFASIAGGIILTIESEYP